MSFTDRNSRLSQLAQVGPRLVPPALVVAGIFACSSRSYVPMPHIQNFDKVVHFFAFGFLATLICRIQDGWKMAILAVAISSAYGAVDELHQYFVPGRSCDVFDWLADTTGASLAVVIHRSWGAYRKILDFAFNPFAGRAAS